jgi:hypothetical protein
MPLFAALVFSLALLLPLSAQANSCRDAMSGRKRESAFDRLSDLRAREIRGMSKSEIRRLNNETLLKIENEVPKSAAKKATFMPFGDAWDVLESMRKHPVVMPSLRDIYSPKDVAIGYCFGRAMYAHLTLLQMGLSSESIRKIWAVGPLQARGDDFTWGFHVATLAYTKEKGWVTIDTNEIKPEPVRDWVSVYSARSVDGRVRFYVTDPSKFNLDSGTYDRVELGLDLSPEEDWYRHYFVHLMKAMRSLSLSDLGLRSLTENSISSSSARNPPPTR